jgi:RNA polymerase sigma-70 factor (ECF subfamily)
LLDDHEQTAVICGLREGSREAWAALYDAYSADVWRYVARLLGGDAASVGDVVQESFMDAARSARQFDSERGSLWSWLAGIAHHRVLAHWRQTNRQARVQQLAESGAVEVRHLVDANVAADAAGHQQDTAELVRSALAELSVDYVALLTAKYLDEQSLADLAQQWAASIEAIKSKLARAREEFRTKFEFAKKAAEHPAHRGVGSPRAFSRDADV